MSDDLLRTYQKKSLADLLDAAESMIRARLAAIATKGDLPGHEFHGNQWTGGLSGGAEESGEGATGETDNTQRMGIAESTAQELGISPDLVEYGGDGYAFTVGDDHFIAAGQFDPSTGKITLYKGALNASEDELRGIVSHEVQHSKFNEVMSKYRDEETSIVHDPQGIDKIYPSGRLRDEYQGEFPVYAKLQPYIFGKYTGELEQKDGITNYSKSYWKAYAEHKVRFETAVNETLAEVAHQKALGIKTGIPNVWRRMYNDLNAEYKRIKK